MKIELTSPTSNSYSVKAIIDTTEGDYAEFAHYRMAKILEYDKQYIMWDLEEIFGENKPVLTYIDFTSCELSYDNAKKIIEFFNGKMEEFTFHEIKFDFTKSNLDEAKSQELYDLMIAKSEVYSVKGGGVVGYLPKTKDGAKMAYHMLHMELDDAIKNNQDAKKLDDLTMRLSHPLLGPKLSDEKSDSNFDRRCTSANEEHDDLNMLGLAALNSINDEGG